ncbi:serine O-acetyltransferase [Sphingomonas gellani]|uniref:Serine acetyltransferase n=1 Tax=Sphingomonas gellani TaxID=1166340 RepID=A0A1H8ASC2_9SPHN|nr:serine acetyltransferase [Sphingomonas gellani]SEM73605.1 serine O-acetyltransferase [Sphingomonas gellani]
MTDRPAYEDAKRADHIDGCARSFRQLRTLLAEDLFRYSGRVSAAQALKHYLFTPGFKYTVWMRSTGYLKTGKVTKMALYPLFKLILLRLRYKYGLAIPENTVIGGGLFINRFGGIYIHNDAIIGRNCNITPGVLLGQINRGSKAGAPTLGDRVFLGSGAKVVGRVTVGDDAAIGVNALVTSDVPPNAVMAAPQATMISERGSGAYINRQV